MLKGAVFGRDHLHLLDCAAETLTIEYVVYLSSVSGTAVCNKMGFSIDETSVPDQQAVGLDALFENCLWSRSISSANLTRGRAKWHMNEADVFHIDTSDIIR